jgi:invasion protein IalB
MILDSFVRRIRAALGLAMASTMPALSPVLAQDTPPAAWRVECLGDGKTLDCRAIQQMIKREDKQVVAQLSARIDPETKAPTLLVQLPLGISLTEPVQFKVDNGSGERQPVQTCGNMGCIVNVPLSGPFLAAMRSGTLLKVSFQDTGKHTLNLDVPLLGFGLAFDKATK